MKRLAVFATELLFASALISCMYLDTTKDTYISQPAPNTNYSNQASFKVGNQQRDAALLRFATPDPDDIPDNVIIESAELQVYAVDGGGNVTMGVFAMIRDSDPDEATWNVARAGEPWGAPGANNTSTDRRSLPEDTITVSEFPEWYSFDVTDLAREWLLGGLPFNGVLLRQTRAADAYILFASSEYNDEDHRPYLAIDATTPTPVPTQPTATRTATRTSTLTRTATASYTTTRTATRTSTPTNTATGTHTLTITRTETPTATQTMTVTSSPTSSPTATLTPTITMTPSATPMPSAFVQLPLVLRGN